MARLRVSGVLPAPFLPRHQLPLCGLSGRPPAPPQAWACSQPPARGSVCALLLQREGLLLGVALCCVRGLRGQQRTATPGDTGPTLSSKDECPIETTPSFLTSPAWVLLTLYSAPPSVAEALPLGSTQHMWMKSRGCDLRRVRVQPFPSGETLGWWPGHLPEPVVSSSE